MKCDKTIQKILEGCSDSETLEHIKDCPDCASLRDFSGFIAEKAYAAGDSTPSDKMDQAVRAAAIEQLGNRKSQEKTGRVKFLYYISALAAAFAIVAGLLLFIPQKNTGSSSPTAANMDMQKGPSSPALQWDDVDLTDEIEGVDEEIEISMSLIYSTDPEVESEDSEDMFTIDMNEIST